MTEEDLDWEKRASMETKRLRHTTGTKIHPCINRALSGRHILIIGSTGSGKTFCASYMTHFVDAFVFINTQRELSVSQRCDVRLESPEELQEALEEGYRAIEFIPNMERETARDEVQVIREQLFELGETIKEQAHTLELPFWFNVFLDEAQIYCPKHTHRDAEVFFTQGRGLGIRSIAITRAPQEIGSEIINNIEYQVIFKTGQYSENYFKSYHIPLEEEKGWLKRTHHFVLFDGFDMQRCLPI